MCPVEYGDSVGYHNWAADVMRWDLFSCANCDEEAQAAQPRRLKERTVDTAYSAYGEYTYLFHEHALDVSDDADWSEQHTLGDNKCSGAIPGFEHRVCVDLRSDDDAKISFAAVEQQDMDDAYYDRYGYDVYY